MFRSRRPRGAGISSPRGHDAREATDAARALSPGVPGDEGGRRPGRSRRPPSRARRGAGGGAAGGRPSAGERAPGSGVRAWIVLSYDEPGGRRRRAGRGGGVPRPRPRRRARRRPAALSTAGGPVASRGPRPQRRTTASFGHGGRRGNGGRRRERSRRWPATAAANDGGLGHGGRRRPRAADDEPRPVVDGAGRRPRSSYASGS